MVMEASKKVTFEQEVREAAMWVCGEGISRQREEQCKGPGVSEFLACLRKQRPG